MIFITQLIIDNPHNHTVPGAIASWINMDETLTGFRFARARDEGVTNGIWIWSEPFLISKGGKRFYVLLMDSQGLFDNKQSCDIDKAIFGLTTMLSSHQIFNVSKQINALLFNYASCLTKYTLWFLSIRFVPDYQNINDSKVRYK